MRITTWNVNGLRAAAKKQFGHHIKELAPDVLMLQEVRALPSQLPAEIAAPAGWHPVWHPAQKLGYSGVATWSKSPQAVMGLGMDGPDPEGRILRTQCGKLHVVNVYLPSGSRSDEAQERKDKWLKDFLVFATAIAQSETPVVLGGDLNIAHTKQDIHNATSNKKTSGFLPHEREWFGTLLASGWTDLVREAIGEQQGPYSWWSNRGQARALDRGWRIDYILGNAAAAKRLKNAWIHRQGGLDTSDHAPVTVELGGRW